MLSPIRQLLVLAAFSTLMLGGPTSSEAGLIPWMYNAVFGPVGSATYYRARYAPAYSGYGYSAGYAAPAVYGGYAPASYSPVSYGGGGCSSCGQSSYYAPTSASYLPYSSGVYGAVGSMDPYMSGGAYVTPACSTCGSGNCSSGTCSNCTANMPTTTTAGTAPAPIPDPNGTSVRNRDTEILNRLREIEQRQSEEEKFLHRQFPQYSPAPSGRETYETVPSRVKSDSFSSESDPDREKFLGPKVRPAGPAEVEEEIRNRIAIPIPEMSTDGEKDSDGKIKESEPQTMKLLDRATTQAVAPRQRMKIATKQDKPMVAKSNKPAVQSSIENTRMPSVARK